MPKQRWPYGARSEAEMQRNLARLGPDWQQRKRDWDERLGFYGPPVPLLPIVITAGIIVGVISTVVILNALW